jgi:nicotinamidase-related amidase
MEKYVPDAFVRSGLERWRRVLSINTIVICGVTTNKLVESTARSAGNLGFKTVIAADGGWVFDKVDFDGGLRSAQDMHAMSLANLHGEYGTVLHKEAILSACASR